MFWFLWAAVLGGLVVGFMAGSSPSPTGGNVAAAVAALLLGVFGFRMSPQAPLPAQEELGLLFIVFLGCLVLAYVGSNVLRKHGLLEWMGISGPKR